jgi:hypothetical protein
VTLFPPYLAACLLLVAAGVAKLARPGHTARAVIALLGSPSERHLPAVNAGVRILALVEAALGAVGTAWPGPVQAGAIAGSYAVFTAFVLFARARGGVLGTCGCFGEPDTPPTAGHWIITATATACAAAVAAGLGHTVTWWHAAGIAMGRSSPTTAGSVALALLAIALALVAYTAMTSLARLGLLARATVPTGQGVTR